MSFEVPARIALAEPDPARMAQMREKFAKSAAPVRPLPSNPVMMLAVVAVFIGLAICLTVPVGFRGFAKLSAFAAVMEYSVLLLLALVLAGGAVEQMIPGARRVLSPVGAMVLAMVLLSITALVLFPDLDTQNFVRRGFPCLRLGVLCAVPGAGAAWVLMRRGFVTDPVRAALAGGALSGLLGIGVLALHCPIFNAPHVIVWHVAVILVTSLAGALLGSILSRFR